MGYTFGRCSRLLIWLNSLRLSLLDSWQIQRSHHFLMYCAAVLYLLVVPSVGERFHGRLQLGEQAAHNVKELAQNLASSPKGLSWNEASQKAIEVLAGTNPPKVDDVKQCGTRRAPAAGPEKLLPAQTLPRWMMWSSGLTSFIPKREEATIGNGPTTMLWKSLRKIILPSWMMWRSWLNISTAQTHGGTRQKARGAPAAGPEKLLPAQTLPRWMMWSSGLTSFIPKREEATIGNGPTSELWKSLRKTIPPSWMLWRSWLNISTAQTHGGTRQKARRAPAAGPEKLLPAQTLPRWMMWSSGLTSFIPKREEATIGNGPTTMLWKSLRKTIPPSWMMWRSWLNISTAQTHGGTRQKARGAPAAGPEQLLPAQTLPRWMMWSSGLTSFIPKREEATIGNGPTSELWKSLRKTIPPSWMMWRSWLNISHWDFKTLCNLRQNQQDLWRPRLSHCRCWTVILLPSQDMEILPGMFARKDKVRSNTASAVALFVVWAMPRNQPPWFATMV